MNREIKELIIDKLKDLPVCHIDDESREFTVRCPYCGDSKTPSHAHLGIRIDPNDDSIMPWHCFRCGESGRVTDDFLSDIDIHLGETELAQLRNYNKKLAKLHKRGIIKTENYRVPLCEKTPLNDQKLMYVSQRIGQQIDYEDAQALKIIPSIGQFMVANEIKAFDGVPKWQINYLEKDYVGFLSSNNNLITLRNIRENGKGRRYYKIIINLLNDDNATFYSIPTKLDMLYTGELHVHIAEGTFDIVSIYKNIHPANEHDVFYASCGYSYMAILKHLCRIGITTHLNLHIYADRDKTDYDHIQMIKKTQIRAFIEHVYIHRNHYPNEKDYGVPADRIDDKARQLW